MTICATCGQTVGVVPDRERQGRWRASRHTTALNAGKFRGEVPICTGSRVEVPPALVFDNERVSA